MKSYFFFQKNKKTLLYMGQKNIGVLNIKKKLELGFTVGQHHIVTIEVMFAPENLTRPSYEKLLY